MSPRLPSTVKRLPLRGARPIGRARLAAAIERLPGTLRLVLALRLLDGLSTIETAGALKLTAREVESRFAAALEALAGEPGSTLERAA